MRFGLFSARCTESESDTPATARIYSRLRPITLLRQKDFGLPPVCFWS